MKSTNEIPHTALDLRYKSHGLMPGVGLHRRGDFFYQESSYSHLSLAGVMLTAAFTTALLPWHTRANVGGELKYWIAGILVIGAICVLLGYFVRNACGQTITIDSRNKMLQIVGDSLNEKFSWGQIVGLQICRQKIPDNSKLNGYQLNLLWTDANGALKRHCLLKEAMKTYVVRLGKRYESLFGFALFDHTQNRQPDAAAKSSPQVYKN